MDTLGNKKMQKHYVSYCCQHCDYTTSRKSSYQKHISTTKHLKLANRTVEETNNYTKLQNSCKNMCEICNKEFQNRSGLWKHNKKIHQNQPINVNKINHDENCCNEIKVNPEIIAVLVQQNKDILTIMEKILKNGMDKDNSFDPCLSSLN